MSRSNSGTVFFALVLIGAGALLLLGNLGLFALNWNLFSPIILILFGLWLVWRAFVPGSNYRGDVFAGFGNYTSDLSGKEIHRESYSHGVGDFDLDLTRAVMHDGENLVRASLGMGDLSVIVPRDLAVRVHASAGMGEANVFGQHSGGFGPTLTFQSDDYTSAPRKLNLEASVGLGEVRVARSQ